MEDELKNPDERPLVLIVDDIEKNTTMLKSLLKTRGFYSLTATSGKKAIMLAETELPDLILLDIMMPEMDGFEVCEWIMENPKTRHIPIIFLTGKADTDDIVKSFQLGAVDYITKPFNILELISRVRTHIELKLSRDAILVYSNELEKSKNKLEQSVSEKDKFFSIIAHEIKSSFSGFLGLSDELEKDLDNMSIDEIKEISKSINLSAKRIYNFMENLLDWSRTQMGKIEFNPIKNDLKENVRAVFEQLSLFAKEKEISLISEIKNNTIAYADKEMLNTILRNLVCNSIKFSSNKSEIKITANQENDNIFISVIDFGTGIDEKSLSDMYKLGKMNTMPGTNGEQGSGVGLILTKELIEKNNGNIWINSTLGVGTEIKFSLPSVS